MSGFDEVGDEDIPVLVMDGTEHTRAKTTGCCLLTGKQCPSCGGWMHYQPVYGGYFYQCETCQDTL